MTVEFCKDVLGGVENHPNLFHFYCPGCKEPHAVTTGANGWQWNGDREKPTFTPSLLIRNGHYANPGQQRCWCTYNAEHPDEPASFVCGVCHSFVKDGMIQFLSDCTHRLAGQTVALPPWRSWNTESKSETKGATKMKTQWANNGEPVDGKYIATIDLEDGKAVQKFEGDSHKEVADKLMVAQGNATQRIRELKAKQPPTLETPARSHQPRSLTADERFEVAADLQDPSKAPEAISKVIEAVTGVSPASIGERLTADEQAEADKRSIAIMKEWANETADYAHEDHNAKLIAAYGQINRLAVTKENLDTIWEALKEAGLAVLKTTTATAAGDEGGLPSRPRGVITQSGVRRDDASRAPQSEGKKLKYTVEEIEAMSEETYDSKLSSEAGFAAAVQAAYATRKSAVATR